MFIECFLSVLGHSRIHPYHDVLDYFRTKRYVRVDRRMTLVKVAVDEDTRMRLVMLRMVFAPYADNITHLTPLVAVDELITRR